MTDQHTPGPWRIHSTDDGLVMADKNTRIASMFGVPGDVYGFANARLIAAAPELLAALIDAESAMFHVLADDGFATPFDQKAMKDAMQAARAAIAKARGK